MKICPICHTKSFADMNTCFACMHRFDEDKNHEQVEFAPNVAALHDDAEDKTEVLEEIAVAEPPQRIEIPLVAFASKLESEPEPEMRGAHVAHQVQAAHVAQAAHVTHAEIIEPHPRLSGRATLRRRPNYPQTFKTLMPAEQHFIPVPGQETRFELVVSLQPVLAEA